MKVIFLFLFAVSTFGLYAPDFDGTLFKKFQLDYNRDYTHSEAVRRKKCFAQSLERIDMMNEREPDATFGINKFADWCQDEITAMMGYRAAVQDEPTAVYDTLTKTDIQRLQASPIDWRAKGAVSSIKDQGHCGSCWSFSAVDTLEGAYAIKTGKLYSLATEELVDCTNQIMPGNCAGGKGTNAACQGGNMNTAISWAVKNGGLNLEEEYPYVSGKDPTTKWCNFTLCKATQHAPCSSQEHIAKDEAQMLAALQKGPLSIAVDAGDLLHYTGGIMRKCENTIPDHGVGIVGYGADENGKGYWIVKNSWAASWGESGYFRAEYGSNQCDVTYDVNRAIA